MECGNQFAMHEEEFPPPLTHPPTDRPACCEHGQLKLPAQNDRDWAGRFWKGIPLLFLLCLGYNSSPLPSFFCHRVWLLLELLFNSKKPYQPSDR